MATASNTVRRGSALPVDAARWAMWTFVIVNAVIVEALFLSAGSGKNGVLTVAKFFGLHAAVLMLFQLLLVARLPWLDRRVGMDRLTVWHRWVGFTLLGMLAAAVIVVIGVISTRSLRRRLRYEVWHGLHLLLYVALGLSFVHQLQESTTVTSSAFATAYWWILWLFAFGALLTGRVAMPLWRNAYHRFSVAAVVPESDNVVSVYVTGRHLDKLPARAGQFCIWRFPGHNHWWLANPFSLSAAPGTQGLRLTAKAAGSTSAGLRNVPVGSRAFVEGPYGAFTSLHRTRPGTLLIAGGVGITPVRAMLEEEAIGDVVVLYRVRSEADAVLLNEVRHLVALRGGRLHLLTGRTGGDGAPPFGPGSLHRLVPDITERDVYVCGPPATTAAVLSGLRDLRVPARQVHAEKFGLA
jgi:predicted ferric reductase